MSANISYTPVKRGIEIHTGAPSRFLKAIPEGRYGPEATDYLRGCAAAGLEGAQELLDAVHKYGEVDVLAEY